MIHQLHQQFLKSTGVSTDTRKILEDNIFFALTGDNFNGNTYAKSALENGASFAVIDDPTFNEGNKYILVDDVLKTLQDLATYHRDYLGIPILALTGSNGKTTTKELINAVLSKKYNTVATKGNLNNHIGVPLTLLSMSSDTEFGIVEMGANHLQEIQALCTIAKPNYGYITNFGKAHLEGFGSVNGIIKGKSELYNYLRLSSGQAFINADDPKQVKQSKGLKTYSFGNHSNADLSISMVEANPLVKLAFEKLHINSQLIGAYNATNIAAAVTIGHYFKLASEAIKKAIEHYTPLNNRSQIVIKKGLTIILDAYNANPSSMEVALDNLKQFDAENKVAILGDMFELGATASEEHQYIAEKAVSLDLNQLILVGKNFKNVSVDSVHIKKFETTESLLKSETFNEFKNATILIKGSRGMALERLLDII